MRVNLYPTGIVVSSTIACYCLLYMHVFSYYILSFHSLLFSEFQIKHARMPSNRIECNYLSGLLVKPDNKIFMDTVLNFFN